MEVNQYSIVLAGQDTSSGNEAGNGVQCVVISPAEMNSALRTITLAPLCPDTGDYPTRVRIKSGTKQVRIALDQIMTIEKKRILKVIGDLSPAEIKKVKSVLKEIFID
ncbi:MAG: type II toxin-antitoxin system PemK/MazF family toxin [Bacteroidales bacterium]|nr:type II toxin-antitoxin system PemK/MazF family toxin [Bacteroidales bacterium]